MTRAHVLVLLAVVAPAGCARKDFATSDPTLAPSASALAPAHAAPGAVTAPYVIQADGRTLLDMPAPKEHIKADTTKAAGTVDLDVKDLTRTRAEVRVDLTTLSTHTFNTPKDADQTRHARTWLEVGDAVDEATREKNRWAVFVIRRVDGLKESDASKLPMEKDEVGNLRTVEATVHGDYLLHGRKVEKSAEVVVRLRYGAGTAPDARPTALEIRSKVPFIVTLAEHDVKPRDTFGKFAQGSLGLLGTKVAETAAVTLELRATPAP